MELDNVIINRRAVYPSTYNTNKIPLRDIQSCLELANWAPTHRRTEPWRFIVFSDHSLIPLANASAAAYTKATSKFDDFKHSKIKKNILKSSHVVAIILHRDIKERVPEWEEIAAVAMAVQNLWLKAHELGIGSYWSSPGWAENLSHFLSLAENERCLGLFYMGYSDAPPAKGWRENWQKKVTFIEDQIDS